MLSHDNIFQVFLCCVGPVTLRHFYNSNDQSFEAFAGEATLARKVLRVTQHVGNHLLVKPHRIGGRGGGRGKLGG